MTLIDYCFTATFQECIFQVVSDVASTIGGNAMAYLFIYSVIMLGATIGAITLRGITYGLASFLALHTIIIILGSASIIPLPAGYNFIGSIVYVVVILMMITAYRTKK